MGKKILMICLILMGIASIASAEGYFGIGVMGVIVEDSDLSGLNELNLVDEAELSFDTGWGAMAIAGFEGDRFRVEGEVAYRNNDFDEIDVGDITVETDDGDITAISGMVNGYLKFDLGGFHPFIGAGVGAANLEADTEIGRRDFEDDTVFAYQGIIGITIPAGTTKIDLGYRYFATEDPEFELEDSNVGLESEYKTHNIYATIRF